MAIGEAVMGFAAAFFTTLKHAWARRETVSYPEVKRQLPARWRGRIVLTRDPDGEERCVGCCLCSAVCPTSCITIEPTEAADERRYAESFQINFSRCIFCGMCEESCPTLAIQLTNDFEMCKYEHGDLIYQKEQLLIDGQGKHPHYNYYRHAGVPIAGKAIGQGIDESPPVDRFSNLP